MQLKPNELIHFGMQIKERGFKFFQKNLHIKSLMELKKKLTEGAGNSV